MAKAEHPHFGIGEAQDGSFIPDDDLSVEGLEAAHEALEAKREASLARVADSIVAAECDKVPLLSEVAQRIKTQIESVKYFSHVKDIAMQLSLSLARELITNGEFEELFALLQDKKAQLKAPEPSEPVDPYAPAKSWSPSDTIKGLSPDPYVDIAKLRANDMPEHD